MGQAMSGPAAAPPEACGATESAAPPAATSDRLEATRSVDSVVDKDGVIARRGHIAVTGRYVTERVIEDDYIIEPKVVGSGMSGPVQLATCRADSKKCAVKSFKKKGLSTRKRNELKSEVEIYLSLDHPHVACLERVFETAEDLHLVMEFMAGGELYDRLSDRKQYTEEDAAETMYQMLLAVSYLHAHQIAHRDLKLENFLYEAKDTNVLKLIDFGFAKFWDRSAKMSQACGSVHYVAPEVLAHAYTEKADMWSLGVILYMLLTGSPPFHGNDNEVLKKIKAGTPHWSSRFNRLSDPAKSLVKQLLVLDPNTRLSANEALETPWVKNKNKKDVTVIGLDTLHSLRRFAHASSFRRAVLSMMAWSLSTEERADLQKQFLSMDTDNKGTVTIQQMKKILEDNFQVDSQEAEELFKSLDTDNDNEIAYSEFLAAALLGRVKVHEDLLRKTFFKFDIDQSGRISAEEMKSILGEHFEGAEVEDLIRDADTDKDGTIDYDEFLAYFQKHEEELGSESSEPAVGVRRSRKRTQTEQLGRMLDRLIDKRDSESNYDGSPAGAASPGASPGGGRTPGGRTPKPLLSKKSFLVQS